MTRVETGRHAAGRVDGRNAYCPSCDVRMVYGELNPNGHWVPQLQLTQNQVDYLLLAAAEFDSIADGDPEATAVEFVDWLTPDVLGRTGDPPHFDGQKPRPGMAGTSTNRHADPIPWGGREAAKLVER